MFTNLKKILLIILTLLFSESISYASFSELQKDREIVKLAISDETQFCNLFHEKQIKHQEVSDMAKFYAKTKLNLPCITISEAFDIFDKYIAKKDISPEIIESFIDFSINNIKTLRGYKYYKLPLILDEIYIKKDIFNSLNASQKIKLAKLIVKLRYFNANIYRDIVNHILSTTNFDKNGWYNFLKLHSQYIDISSLNKALDISSAYGKYDIFISEAQKAGLEQKIKQMKPRPTPAKNLQEAINSTDEVVKVMYLKSRKFNTSDLTRFLYSFNNIGPEAKFCKIWSTPLINRSRSLISDKANPQYIFELSKTLAKCKNDTQEYLNFLVYIGNLAIKANQHDYAKKKLNYVNSSPHLNEELRAIVNYLLGKAHAETHNDYISYEHFLKATENPISLHGQAAAQKINASLGPLIRSAIRLGNESYYSDSCYINSFAFEYINILNYRSTSYWQSFHAMMNLMKHLKRKDVCLFKTALHTINPKFNYYIGFLAAKNNAPIKEFSFPNEEYDPLISAIIKQESSNNISSISNKQAMGLMQLKEIAAREAAKELRIPFNKNLLLTDRAYNVKIGSHYINKQMKFFSMPAALAGYNAGRSKSMSWVEKFSEPKEGDLCAYIEWSEKLPYAETKNYIQNVTSYYNVYSAMKNK